MPKNTEAKNSIAPELQNIKTTRPWQKVGIDLVGRLNITQDGHCYMMSVTCLFSKWVELYPAKISLEPRLPRITSKKDYSKRLGKGVKTFLFQEGTWVSCVTSQIWALHAHHNHQ